MTGSELVQEMKQNITLLDAANASLPNRGRLFAKAEHDYSVAKSKEILIERANGTPVTILLEIVKGKPEIARLRMERDIAERMYESCREAINSYKLKIKIISGQIEREWKS